VFFGLSKKKPKDHIEEGFPILVRKENKQTQINNGFISYIAVVG
jgi:hypothetical protein